MVTPISGKVYTQAVRSSERDLALDAARAAAKKWGATPAAERANLLLKIADRIEQNTGLPDRRPHRGPPRQPSPAAPPPAA